MKNNNLKSSDLKKVNKQNILRFAFSHDLITKQEIAMALKISQPTVAACLNDLVSEGLMKFEGTASSTGGRKAQYVAVNKESVVSIGVSLTKHHLRFIAINTCAEKIAYQEIKYVIGDVENLAEHLSCELSNFIDENKLSREKIIGVGIALPGIISYQKQKIELSPSLGFKNVDFKRLTCTIPYNTFIFNDADAGGFAEWWSRGRDENIVYLSVDRGVGGSVYLNEKPYLGDHGHSAEFGHMCIVPNGKLCSCRRRGCFEAYCSIANLSDDLNCEIEDFFDSVCKDNEKYEKILDEYLEMLAVGMKNIYMIFDSKIILGGGLAKYSDVFEKKLSDKLMNADILESGEKIFKIGKYGLQSSCFGAALNWIEKLILKL